MKMLCTLLIAASLAMVVAGCGGGSASPRGTFRALVAAATADDLETMKTYFTTETGANFERFEEIIESMGASQVRSITATLGGSTPTYGAEEIDGDRATLEVTIEGKQETVIFIKEDNRWKVSIPELKESIELMEGMGDTLKSFSTPMLEGGSESVQGMGDMLREMTKSMPKK